MLNLNRNQAKVKIQKALATSGTEGRGFAPTSGLMAMTNPFTNNGASKNHNGIGSAFQISVFFLALFTILVSVAAGNVEFKHHNNTEMAEILQQIHNR